MKKSLIIPDVTAEKVMEVVESLSPRIGDLDYIRQYVGSSEATIRRAIGMGQLLGLVKSNDSKEFSVTGQCKSVSSLYYHEPRMIFKNALVQFNPFTFCSSLLMKGNSLTQSIRKTRAVYDINTDEKVISKVFNNFCRFIGLEDMSKASLDSILGEGNSPMGEFTKRVATRLNNELEANMFLSDKLGEQCFCYITNPERNYMTKSIISHQSEPSNSISDFAGAFESFLRRAARDKGVDVETCNGISQIGQVLASKENQVLLPEHRSLCDFFSAFRNPSTHKVQKSIVEHWQIEPDSSIEIILLGISSLRSIYEWIFNEKLRL